MVEIRISLHSIIDVITNSSTEIFTYPKSDAPKMIKDIINSILEDAGSEFTCEDLYTVKLETDDEYVEERMKDHKDLEENYPEDASWKKDQFEDMATSIVIESTGTKEQRTNAMEITEKINKLFDADEYSSD